MSSYRELEESLTHTLSLSRRPVAIAFRAHLPTGVSTFKAVEGLGLKVQELRAPVPDLAIVYELHLTALHDEVEL